MPFIQFKEATSRMLQNYVDGKTFHLLLTSGSTFTKASGLADIVTQELAEANNYTRQAYVPSTGAYDDIQERYELPGVATTFSAQGGFLQYDRIALISGGSSNANKTFTADPATNRLTATNHGLANGDKVILTADAGGNLPAGANSAQLYYAVPVDADTVELYADANFTTSVTFASAGNGTLRLRYANGNVELYGELGSTTIADGQSQTIVIHWNHGGGNVDVEAP